MIDVKEQIQPLIMEKLKNNVLNELISNAAEAIRKYVFEEVREDLDAISHNLYYAGLSPTEEEYKKYDERYETDLNLLQYFNNLFDMEIKESDGNGSINYTISFAEAMEDSFPKEKALAEEMMQRALIRFNYRDLSDYWSG